MHWVLQNNLFAEPGWEALHSTLERFAFSHSVHRVVPFVGELVPGLSLPHRNVICFGAYSMRHVARRHGWSPGVFDLFEQDFTQQRAHWGSHLLNAHSVVCRFGDVQFDDELKFIRPTTDSKSFAGRVFDRVEFTGWQASVRALKPEDGSTLTDDTEVQVATPVVIHAEYRYWVVRGAIVTRSLYKRGRCAHRRVRERAGGRVAAA
jgi:ATP-grasp domain, R2K clade family 3